MLCGLRGKIWTAGDEDGSSDPVPKKRGGSDENGSADPVPKRRGASGSSRHLTGVAFEQFAPSVKSRKLPIVLFSDDGKDQLVWHKGRIVDGQVFCPQGDPDVRNPDAVVMSPAYLGFAIEPYEPRYLHYRDVGILFARPRSGEFMQPSIDTILVCAGLAELFFNTPGLSFNNVIDVGTGSGFIGKFAGVHAPGEGRLSVTLSDIDKAAAEYCQSASFGARDTGAGGREVAWRSTTGDAAGLLEKEPGFDLIVSNPPYIPAREEAKEQGLMNPVNFWEGCGLLVRLLEMMAEGRHPAHAHLVVGITSLTLKSCRVRALLEAAPSRGLVVRILVEREVAWKAWYAGRGGGPSYLLATAREVKERKLLGDCAFFVGATPPGQSRQGGKRDRLPGYHWHMAYVLDISQAGATVAAEAVLPVPGADAEVAEASAGR